MMDMKRIYNILLIMILSLFLLPLGGCFDSDINRSMYEADGEEMQRENHIVGATLKGMQGLVIPHVSTFTSLWMPWQEELMVAIWKES